MADILHKNYLIGEPIWVRVGNKNTPRKGVSTISFDDRLSTSVLPCSWMWHDDLVFFHFQSWLLFTIKV